MSAEKTNYENSRNDDNGTVSGDIATGKSVKIRSTTINGSAVVKDLTYTEEAVRNTGASEAIILQGNTIKQINIDYVGTAIEETHIADEVVASSGGNWDDSNLLAGDEGNVADGVAFGLSQTGTLIAGTPVFYVTPVSYTHLTLPTNREV